MGKGEIAHYETCTADMKKPGLVWERLNPLPNDKILDWSKLKACEDDKINMIEKLDNFGVVDN